MFRIDSVELITMKLLMVKDLERSIIKNSSGRYKNFIFNIKINTKKFMRRVVVSDLSAEINKYNVLSSRLTSYVLGMFNVLGENALLAVKRNFEENAVKWAKKARKRIGLHNFRLTKEEIHQFIMDVYINLPNSDHLEYVDHRLVWHFKKDLKESNGNVTKEGSNKIYELKQVWLNTFIKNMFPSYSVQFKPIYEDSMAVTVEIKIEE